MPSPLLQVDQLRIAFGDTPVVDGVSFALQSGRIVALVGESGSGKSLTARALLGLLPEYPAPQVSGSIVWQPETEAVALHELTDREWTAFRGSRIGLILQEPMSSLHPTLRIRQQLREVTRNDSEIDRLLIRVGLDDTATVRRKYPHELSGGQLQRVCIAMALLGQPELLIADEPTTALDNAVQQEIIELLRDLRDTSGIAILFISHDLRLVESLADEVWVMRHGKLVEQQATQALFAHPEHPYTRKLLAPISIESASAAPSQCALLHGKNLHKSFVTRRNLLGRVEARHTVFEEVSLTIKPGEVVGLVGASGSGKTTLGRCLLGLLPLDAGQLYWGEKQVSNSTDRDVRLQLAIQVIFQNPYAALTPRMTIGNLIEEPLRAHEMVPRSEARATAMKLLEQVGLSAAYQNRYAHQLSGGERQRVCIARALAVRPQLLICDECLSALDRKIQGDILKLLLDLRATEGLALLFISHDEPLVRQIASRVYRMANGRLTEEEPPGKLDHPHHDT